MPSFPSGAIERLPWRQLEGQVIHGDTRTYAHFAMSPMSRSLHRLRQQWSACEDWERFDKHVNDDRARIRFARRILTPGTPSSARTPSPMHMVPISSLGAWSEEMHDVVVSESLSRDGAQFLSAPAGAPPTNTVVGAPRRVDVSEMALTPDRPTRGQLHANGHTSHPAERVTVRVSSALPSNRSHLNEQALREVDRAGTPHAICGTADHRPAHREIYQQYLETRIKRL